MEIGGFLLGCTGIPSTGPGQCQDTLAALEAVLFGGQCPTAGLRVDFHPLFPRGNPSLRMHPFLHLHLLFLVKFRVVSLDKDFTPSNKKVRTGGNRIAQWREVSPRQGIVDLSLPLAAEPALGTYIIQVEGKSHSFSVEEYGTWGPADAQGVGASPRHVPVVQLGSGCHRDSPFPGLLLTGLNLSCQTEKNGCFSTEVLLTAFNLPSSTHNKQLQVEALLVEDGTGRDSGVLLLGNGLCCWCMVLYSSLRAPICMWHRAVQGSALRAWSSSPLLSHGPGLRGSFSLELPIGPELAPTAKVLGYVVLPNSEMVADSAELKVAKCFLKKMVFSEDRALPGSALQLELEAAPGSLCAVRAVDRSVLLLKPEAELNAEVVSGGTAQGPFCSPRDQPGMGVGRDDIGLDLPYGDSVPWWLLDGQPLFFSQNAALKLFTNAKTGDVCEKRFGGSRSYVTSVREETDLPQVMYSAVSEVMDLGIPVVAVQEEPPAPRTYFPETWLWDLVPGGSTEMTVTVPDAITEWKAGMFCTSPLGLGLAPTISLTAFKPFFVELALPYAVVRHEAFTLVATVFNYLRQCLRVSGLEVSASWGALTGLSAPLASAGEVNITVSTEALSSKELCGNETPVVPAQGRVDTVIKPLLVQPGGILVEKAHNSLLCQEGRTGDIMGNALQNLDHLLAMPYGCGEQNMVRFAPNIYIQQYLEKSGQLHPDIRAKAQGFLQSGYQRELLFKHDDGSYSAFGKSDPTGNTWLTAFVLKSFGQARAYVAIEERHIQDALHWLQKQQQQTGCFRSVGKLFNNALQGGVSDELSLSAYVTAAMLELGLSPTVRMTPSGGVGTGAGAGSPAVLGHLLSRTGHNWSHWAELGTLSNAYTRGELYWQMKGKALVPSQPSRAVAAPSEVEMTAYVLLAYLSQPQVSSADLLTALQIVRWLSKQQNPYGGFASTQDTVVALQALAKYAALTYSSNGDLTVTVTSPTGTTQDFVLHNSNRLVLRRADLHQLPGTYGVGTAGGPCPRVTLRYNVPPPPSAGTFDLRVETEPGECTVDAHPKPTPGLCPCRYTGERPTTNMVVIEAKLPSGYIPDKSSMVERQKLVKKVEVQLDQVTIYLDQLTKEEEETFAFSATQDFPVSNLQPATVTLYDYYETGEDAAYSAPCSSGRGQT
uniref:Alpha-2-macroglobulin-like protein 1 n=1 Tax=Buteo japonicus TaxID=224669 RepID=A0A8C0BJ74_9AVES